jgi:hypothetical protein
MNFSSKNSDLISDLNEREMKNVIRVFGEFRAVFTH